MKLGEILSLVRGNTYKSALLSDTEGPFLLGLGSIERGGGFKNANLKRYPGPSDNRILLHPGDIYVSLKDLTQSCDLLGAVSRVPCNVPEGRLTQDTVKLEFAEHASNREMQYTYWSLRTPQYRSYCKARGTGTTNMSLSRSDFLAWKLPPFTPTHDSLISLFESIESKIALNNRLNGYLEELADSLFRDMFGGQGDNATLADVAAITMGQSPAGDSYNEEGVGAVFYQGRGEFGWRFPMQRLFTTEPRRTASADDVLMSVRAPVGDLNVAYEDCCIGRGLAAISSEHHSFCLYLMRSLKKKLDAFNGEGTVFGSINGRALNGLSIYAPPSGAINSFETRISPVDKLVRTNEAENRNLEALRDSLLPKLMTGEIDVSKIDITRLNSHLASLYFAACSFCAIQAGRKRVSYALRVKARALQ